ncbi:hypothetical protein O5154_28730, partial [Escherichia coli]|nr:hypothetical protein [Escherichia coli]
MSCRQPRHRRRRCECVYRSPALKTARSRLLGKVLRVEVKAAIDAGAAGAISGSAI